MFYFTHPFGISTPSTNRSNKSNSSNKNKYTTYIVTEIQKNFHDDNGETEKPTNVGNHENLYPWPKSMVVRGE